ncbi:MAG: EamA family transporter [Anaerolineae bacterium]
MQQHQQVWPDRQTWPLLLLTGTVDVVISRALYYLALRRLRLSFHAILLTLTPAITVLWSWLLFGVWPTVQGLLGGAAVIAGVGIVSWYRQQATPLPEV